MEVGRRRSGRRVERTWVVPPQLRAHAHVIDPIAEPHFPPGVPVAA